jgi:hypothetical protein
MPIVIDSNTMFIGTIMFLIMWFFGIIRNYKETLAIAIGYYLLPEIITKISSLWKG